MLVLATEVILQNMEMETEMGQKAKEMLFRGEAVPEEMVAKMIEDKINSPEVLIHFRFFLHCYILPSLDTF